MIDGVQDAGGASVADETTSEEFTEAEHNADVLQQVRDSLGRVEDGTFGRCLVWWADRRATARGGDVDAILSEARGTSFSVQLGFAAGRIWDRRYPRGRPNRTYEYVATRSLG